jgi:hypothetical protein
VLRRYVFGGILRFSFGERPSVQCHSWALRAREVVPSGSINFGDR